MCFQLIKTILIFGLGCLNQAPKLCAVRSSSEYGCEAGEHDGEDPQHPQERQQNVSRVLRERTVCRALAMMVLFGRDGTHAHAPTMPNRLRCERGPRCRWARVTPLKRNCLFLECRYVSREKESQGGPLTNAALVVPPCSFSVRRTAGLSGPPWWCLC